MSSPRFKRLPLGAPAITGYHHRAMPLSILGAFPSMAPWLMDHLVQVCCATQRADSHRIFDLTDPNLLEASPDGLSIERLDRASFGGALGDLRRIVLDSLASDRYVHLWVDEFFVPERAPFGQEHVAHDLLMVGYDDASETFAVTGFDALGKYVVTSLSYAQFDQATQLDASTAEALRVVLLVEADASKGSAFEGARLRRVLGRYASGERTEEDSIAWAGNAPALGLATYAALSAYVADAAEHRITLEPRAFQMLAEHKELMARRVRFLEAGGPIEGLADLAEAFTALGKTARTTRNGVIKYLLTGETKLLERVRGHLSAMEENERALVKDLIAAC